MILEAIVTTRNLDGTTNLSPMGPTITEDLSRFELRPFDTSTTFANLQRTRVGIMHVTDDVLLIARAAIGRLTELPTLVPGKMVDVNAVADACRWYEFRVTAIDESGPRMKLSCETVYQHRQRDFWGFNRAKHAVLEGAILATRIELLPAEEITEQFERLSVIVEKTAGEQERAAFELLQSFVNRERVV